MVKLEAPGAPLRQLLGHCEVLGTFGACGMSSYSDSDFVRRGTRLYCTVTGKLVTGGTYRCSSGG